MNSFLGFFVGILQATLSLLGIVQQHPELPQPVQDQATQVAQQVIHEANKEVNSFVLTAPTAGTNVSPGEQMTIRWKIPDAILSSFPSDFDLGLFLNVVQKNATDVNVYGINDGMNDPKAGFIVWKVPADAASGEYKIKAYLQAELKDPKRMCDPAYSVNKDCSPNPADRAVMTRSTQIKADSEWFTISKASSNSGVSVPGMSKYTDSDFGFSFWYPSDKKVSIVNSRTDSDQTYGTGTKILKTIAAPAFTIDEVYSPNGQILGDGQKYSDPSPLSSYFYYFFDKNSHAWMEYSDGGPKGDPAGTGAADVSNNTMGGLHIFPGYARFSQKVIIPLTAHNFLVLNASYSAASDEDTKAAAKQFTAAVKTILATDPSVATPISAAEQIATIQAEKDAYTITLLTASPSSGPAPLIVNFTPAFLGMGEHWIDFGDGTKATAVCAQYKPDTDACLQMKTLVHTYAAAGTYTATLKERDMGTDKVWGSVTVIVR